MIELYDLNLHVYSDVHIMNDPIILYDPLFYIFKYSNFFLLLITTVTGDFY